MKTLEFKKYEGLGNDFVLVPLDALSRWLEQVTLVCDRHRGIGADGIVGYAQDPHTRQVSMVIHNADGTRPQMCGNGVRCVVAALADSGALEAGDAVLVQSDAGPRPCVLGPRDAQTGSWQVAVEMGEPVVAKRAKGFLCGHELSWVAVDMGNPHAVTWFAPESLAHADRLGQAANADAVTFPQGVNLEFVTPTALPHVVEVMVYERGVGRTQACGTGACAVAVALWEGGQVDRGQEVEVRLPGGPLKLRWEEGRVWMNGPARQAFEGKWRR